MSRHEDTILRRTGRTTRMLECAIRKAAEGKLVLIYFSKMSNVDHMSRRLWRMQKGSGVSWSASSKFETRINSGCIFFKRIGADFDWRSMRSAGEGPPTIALVDHYTIEQAFPEITDMLYKFIDMPKDRDNEDRQD